MTSEDIRGFFVEHDSETVEKFTLIRVHRAEMPRKKIEEAELHVLDRHGEPIGKYYLGRVLAAFQELPHVGDDRHPDLDFSGYTWEYPKAGEIWKKWARGIEYGEWARQPPEWHPSWLHVVQNAWFTAGKAATRYGTGSTAVLDGTKITSREAFFCALGEAVNGTGGYFGSSHGGLLDCLRNAQQGGTPPFELIWRDFSVSRAALGDDFAHDVASACRQHGVTVTQM
ncbi:barstar family protein [Streptomyces thermospinosisporus]|uniref:barstar family protein n=1 Tax=Streptomyces thermospinosisporus TaxID=161482 RepID=UPI0031D052EB